jgi:hypothetical protein
MFLVKFIIGNHFSLSESVGGAAITTTAGTTTGLSFTTGHNVTLSTGTTTGDAILLEVDAYTVNPYYANNIAYGPVTGAIDASSNTIQLAIDSLESRKITTTAAQANVGAGLITVTNAYQANVGAARISDVATLQANTGALSIGLTNEITGRQANVGAAVISVTNAYQANVGAGRIADVASGQANVGAGLITTKAAYEANVGVEVAARSANVGAGLITITSAYQANVGAGLITTKGAYEANVGSGLISAKTTSEANVGAARLSAISTASNADNLSSGTVAAGRLGTTGTPQFASLGIGTAASGTTGEIRATGDITAGYSDDKLKTRLGNIENALDKVSAISGFFYEPNKTAQDLGFEVKREVGVSAQEVQAIMPEVVVPAPIDNQYLTVHYEKLIPLLIEAIKELRAEVEEIKGQIK